MSSITFPGHNHSFALTPSEHEPHHFSSPSFDNASASGSDSFQMNPLSSHPPRSRTPRVSLVSTHSYSAEAYSVREEDITEKTYEEDSEPDEEVLGKEVPSAKVRKEEIWREILLTSNGRDKAFKIMQYSLRLYLLFHTSILATTALRGDARPQWEKEVVQRCNSAIGGFSLTRKCLILFNWLTPLTSILAQNGTVPYSAAVSSSSKSQTQRKPLLHTFLHTSPPVLLGFINGVSDDVYTFSRLGLLGAKTGERAGRFADWCWFASTLVNLVENTVERSVLVNLQHEVESRLYAESMTGATNKSNPNAQKVDRKELARLQRQDYWIQMTRLKLLMDFIFVSYNVFNLKRAKGQIQTFTGLAAALLSTAKLYDRHKVALAKAVTV